MVQHRREGFNYLHDSGDQSAKLNSSEREIAVLCLLKTCPKCSGDLVLDGDELRCWQCGQYYYPKPGLLDMPEEPPAPDLIPSDGDTAKVSRGRPLMRRAPRNINSRIMSRDRSDLRWRVRNREIIRHLDQGLSVREVSVLVGRGERQIRIIRERLQDLRDSGAEGQPAQVGSR